MMVACFTVGIAFRGISISQTCFKKATVRNPSREVAKMQFCFYNRNGYPNTAAPLSLKYYKKPLEVVANALLPGNKKSCLIIVAGSNQFLQRIRFWQ